jgi:hypothetical protein
MPQPIQIAWDRIRILVAHYFFGLFAKSFNGATVALDGFLGLAAGAAISESVTKPNWQVAAAIFGTAFVRNALVYFKEHPVPEKLPELTQPPFSVTLK